MAATAMGAMTTSLRLPTRTSAAAATRNKNADGAYRKRAPMTCFRARTAIDGASMWQRVWHVTLPALRPAIGIATTLGIVNGLRIFDQILALTGGGPANATATLATEVYKQAFSLGNFGYGSALALLLTAIILVFAVAQQRVTQVRSEK